MSDRIKKHKRRFPAETIGWVAKALKLYRGLGTGKRGSDDGRQIEPISEPHPKVPVSAGSTFIKFHPYHTPMFNLTRITRSSTAIDSAIHDDIDVFCVADFLSGPSIVKFNLAIATPIPR